VVSAKSKIVIITPTWAGDVDHFRVMRQSVERSSLAELEHYVVVQDEDMPLFEEFRGRSGLNLLSTADVLPPEVERKRRMARRLSDRFGRNVTRLAGSLRRLFSFPEWPSYTGWHTQQLCKLQLASELECDVAVILDSDVVVTKAASCQDFMGKSRTVCFATWSARSEVEGKVKNWVAESESLVGTVQLCDPVNVYFDTPFVFDSVILREALRTLEVRSGKLWWETLLARPPRRWSEFGFYKAFLGNYRDQQDIEWRAPDFSRYIYNTSNSEMVIETVRSMLADSDIHYITIHSHASGRETWSPDEYLGRMTDLLDQEI